MTLITDLKSAQTTAPILEVLAERWSPRSYTDEVIDEEKLASALEAARWSPSAGNSQPWRFIVARRGTPAFEKVAASLMGFNQVWAPTASVLLVGLYTELRDQQGNLRPTPVYDLGQAMAHLSVQAHHDGLHVHQMTGFVGDELAAAFDLPADVKPFVVAAVGTVGSPDDLDQALAERERQPRTRLALDDIVLVNE
ncbi:nitroreductase family protein [Gryllotalpicola protaetiae]|uniref:Nitroreductase n=1 Tax=Gryllotalpicola protaetiae TaxID=2419771 RepID=A0A387BQJ3_9MICO|nr:nitroreductase family protein [Gryllotalpicola protaetiae]AYG03300.1 nitroreductase [Gryllotalpicola protaetiae]